MQRFLPKLKPAFGSDLLGRCQPGEALDQGVRGEECKGQEHCRAHEDAGQNDRSPRFSGKAGWASSECVARRQQSNYGEAEQRRDEAHSGKRKQDADQQDRGAGPSPGSEQCGDKSRISAVSFQQGQGVYHREGQRQLQEAGKVISVHVSPVRGHVSVEQAGLRDAERRLQHGHNNDWQWKKPRCGSPHP